MLSAVRTVVLPAVSVLVLAALLPAQSEQEQEAKPPAAAESTLSEQLATYLPKSGEIEVGSVATARLGEGWLWLDGANGRRFLADLGNRPGPATLGVALPPDFGDSGVFAVYSYADEGHIEDDEDPDYDELLTTMQENAREESDARRQAGLQGVELLGWAEPPHYDKQQHKMYWAERLQFEGEDSETLNYNVRVLGRTGHLVVNGVGGVEQLALVAKHNKELLQVTEFIDGQRYSDFDPGIDKVAAYGIGGLIAGKLALKAGLFAKFAVLLKVIWKPLIAGLVIIGGLLFKVLGSRKKAAEEQVQPAIEE